MCLAVAGRIVELEEQDAVVDIEGNRVNVSTVLVPDATLNDYVMIHTGFAISKLSEDDYAEHQRLMQEIDQYAREALENES
jgi:hydrogenase expression/formation protein HypC